MKSDIDESDAKADVLGIFLEELQNAADPESVLSRYVATYPHWARDFVEETVVSRMLVTSRSESTFPDLSKLTDFRILRWVAAGGMGVVYEAEQISLRRRVALKVRYGHSSPEREERFLREQHTLARLHQSHIVPIYLSGRCGFWHYFVMAYIEGVTLHQLIKSAREVVDSGRTMPPFENLVRQSMKREESATEASRLADFASDVLHSMQGPHRLNASAASPEAQREVAVSARASLPIEYFRSAARLMADAADAIEHAHGADVIHRDIKPSNIMVDVVAQCWLIDFGLADHAEPVEIDASTIGKTARESRSTGTVGTPGYMAPEQIQNGALVGRSVDFRTDVWGLGATLFELVTLQRPFQGATPQELCASVLTQPLPAVDGLVRNIPADLAAVCRKALHKDSERRYQRATDLADDLRRWLTGVPTVARPAHQLRAGWMWARRNKGWAAALTTGFLLLVAFAAILVVDARHEARQSDLRREAAEERIREEQARIRLHEREALIHDVQRLRSADLNGGWSDQAWGFIQKASAIQTDGHLRDLAASVLAGIDARVSRRLEFGGSSVAFDATENRFVIGGLDDSRGNSVRTATLWEMEGDKKGESPLRGEGPVGFAPDGTPLQVVFQDPHVVVWDMARKKDVRRLYFADIGKRDSKTDSPTLVLADNAALVGISARVEGKKGKTIVWEVGSGKVVFEVDEYADVMAFSRKGDLLAAADVERNRVVVRSLSDKTTLLSIPAGPVFVRSLAFGAAARRPENRPADWKSVSELLAIGDAGGSIVIWDLATRMPVSFCRGSHRDIFALAFNSDGALLASGGRDEVQIWDVAHGRSRLRISGGMDYATQISFSPNGRRLAVSTRGIFYSPTVIVWDLEYDRGMRRMLGLTGQIETVVISPDGRSLAALSQSWEVGIWDLKAGNLRAVVEVPPGRSFADNAALAFSADGRQLAFSATGFEDSTAMLWDALTAKELGRWKLPAGLQNRLGFDGANHLWHFQVELKDRTELPTNGFPWEQHPRVCRIRDLKGDPMKVVEIRDFNCHVYHALATPDGKFFIADGVGGERGDQRSVKIIEGATGKAVWTYTPERTVRSANLQLDALGKSVFVAVKDDDGCLQVSMPDGTILSRHARTPIAANMEARLHCYPKNQKLSGCFLFRDGESQPILNLALDNTIDSAAFDKSGKQLVWGGRDGSIVVCDLPAIRKRLESVGLGW
jgi:serine/threonine protein kinase/WD40 repeat protein